jgi:hypothetical protein
MPRTENDARNIGWRDASYSVSGLVPDTLYVVQQLGSIDLKLIVFDNLLRSSEGRRQIEGEALELNFHITLSYLWVLGLYEIVRTVSQRIRETPGLVEPAIRREIDEFKLRVERLRVPLAKMEPARRHESTDFDHPVFAVHSEFGTAWFLTREHAVSRRELSDEFLRIFRDLPHTRRGDRRPGPRSAG